MAAFTPFQPAVKSGTAGFTQVVALGSGSATSQTIQFSNQTESTVLAQGWNNNAAGGTQITAYVRISVESSASIAATLGDMPLIIPPQNSAVRLFSAPAFGTNYNIAVIVTVTPSIAGSFLQFTPGIGGIL